MQRQEKIRKKYDVINVWYRQWQSKPAFLSIKETWQRDKEMGGGGEGEGITRAHGI